MFKSSNLRCPLCKKDASKLDGRDQSAMLVDNDKKGREEFLINIDPLTRSAGSDHRKWNSTFDVHTRAGLRWKQWKLLTGDPG